jgi:hypothetical protein
VTTDANGEAVVELPEWFEALNRDFRYQLTPIGGAGPDLHIAEHIAGNRFKIAGGTARLRVSWQVTGVRQDAWAQANQCRRSRTSQMRSAVPTSTPRSTASRTSVACPLRGTRMCRQLASHDQQQTETTKAIRICRCARATCCAAGASLVKRGTGRGAHPTPRRDATPDPKV